MTEEAFLLCGGRGRRFGSDKRFIRIKGKPLYLYQLDKLKPFFPNVTLLCKKGEEHLFIESGVTIVSEEERDTSLLCGIIAGLSDTQKDHVLFLSVDMPLLPVEAIKFFRNYPVDNRPLIPFVDNNFHTGFSVFPKSVLNELVSFKNNNIYAFKAMFPFLNPVLPRKDELPFLTAHQDALFNINTPADLLWFQEKYPDFEPLAQGGRD